MLWAGYIASALTVLVLLISGVIKFVSLTEWNWR